MSEWVAGYRAALADVGRLSPGRVLAELLADLDGDALAAERYVEHLERAITEKAARHRVLPELELALERLVDEPPP